MKGYSVNPIHDTTVCMFAAHCAPQPCGYEYCVYRQSRSRVGSALLSIDVVGWLQAVRNPWIPIG